MIHCLDDSGKPMSLLDLRFYSHADASELLVSLYGEMTANPKRWERRTGEDVLPGVRVVIPCFKEKDPLSDPRKHHYGLHPDFGFMTCVFWRVDRGVGTPAIMYVVRPMEPEKPSLWLRLVG